jgi:hypothetical protein
VHIILALTPDPEAMKLEFDVILNTVSADHAMSINY